MKTILDGALRSVAALTPRQHLVEATKVIQSALSGEAWGQRGAPTSAEPQENGPSNLALRSWSALTPLQPDPASAVEDAKVSPMAEIMQAMRDRLAPGVGLGAPAKQRADVRAAEAAQFVSRSYSAAAGSRDYKLFVPGSVKDAAPRALSLVVMLHGCNQNPDDFALGTGMNELAEERGFLVVYPKQSAGANHMGCWNWFNVKDQARESGEPSIIAGITREIIAEFGVDQSRVFVAGLSAGGAMAAILSATYPDIFKAAGIHSGLACGAANDVASAFASMRNGATIETATQSKGRVRTIVFQGVADRTVHPSNADLIVAVASAALEGAVETRHRGRSEGGVAYERTVIADSRGAPQVEYWAVEDMGHAWSGGRSGGSFTDPQGPDASREMLRFFLQH